MEVGGFAGIGDGDGVTTYIEVFIVERLVDVAEELGCMSKGWLWIY